MPRAKKAATTKTEILAENATTPPKQKSTRSKKTTAQSTEAKTVANKKPDKSEVKLPSNEACIAIGTAIGLAAHAAGLM